MAPGVRFPGVIKNLKPVAKAKKSVQRNQKLTSYVPAIKCDIKNMTLYQIMAKITEQEELIMHLQKENRRLQQQQLQQQKKQQNQDRPQKCADEDAKSMVVKINTVRKKKQETKNHLQLQEKHLQQREKNQKLQSKNCDEDAKSMIIKINTLRSKKLAAKFCSTQVMKVTTDLRGTCHLQR